MKEKGKVMTTMKKTAKKTANAPVPDVKSVTRTILERIANWADFQATNEELGIASRKYTQEEQSVLREARQLAINYVRMGTNR